MSSGTDEVTFESFPNRKQEKAESGMEEQWLGRFIYLFIYLLFSQAFTR